MGALIRYKVAMTIEVEIGTDKGMAQAHQDAIDEIGKLFAQRDTPHGAQAFINAIENTNVGKSF